MARSKALRDAQVFALAWRVAGGWKGFFKGFDFKISMFIWVLCIPAWTNDGWWDQSLSVLPNLLGFTLGGFAIFLGFGSDHFQRKIADERVEKSIYMSVSSAFLLFVTFQVFALLFAIACKALWIPTPAILAFAKPYFLNFGNYFFWGIGFFLFIYSISLGLRAAARIFRVSRWYNDFLVVEEQRRMVENASTSRDGAAQPAPRTRNSLEQAPVKVPPDGSGD